MSWTRAFLCAAAVLSVSAQAVAWETASVVDVAGVPRFAIDGKPMPATAAMPRPQGNPGDAESQLRAFRDAGVTLFSDVWTMNDRRYAPRHWWIDDGEYDFKAFDLLARALVAAAPDGFVFPRIKIDPPPKWAAAHPEEMASPLEARLSSARWRDLYRRMLSDMVAHVERSDYADRVVGWRGGMP